MKLLVAVRIRLFEIAVKNVGQTTFCVFCCSAECCSFNSEGQTMQRSELYINVI